jgi:hypothetical protein
MEILNVFEPSIKNTKFQEFVNTKIFRIRSERQTLCVAGGACRSFVTGEEPTDYDLFLIGADGSGELKFDVLSELDEKYKRIFTCPEGLLHSWQADFGKIQLITPVEYGSLYTLFDSFDFELCRFAYDGSNLYYTQDAWDDVTNKKLTLLNVSYPLATMNRIYKYQSYGYQTASAKEELLRQVKEREFSDESLYRHYID